LKEGGIIYTKNNLFERQNELEMKACYKKIIIISTKKGDISSPFFVLVSKWIII